MKSLTLKTTLTAIALAFTASSISAAPANGPKPKCHVMGEIAVLSGGEWVCKQPSIRAKGNGMESATSGSKITQKRPVRAFPDYVITKVTRSAGNSKQLTVTIKNQGAKGNVAGSELYAKVMNSNLGTTAVAMPDLKAGQSLTTFINFTKAPDRGSRIRLMADGNKRVKESNENNNVKFFNY